LIRTVPTSALLFTERGQFVHVGGGDVDVIRGCITDYGNSPTPQLFIHLLRSLEMTR
jgi:hypothetical protein